MTKYYKHWAESELGEGSAFMEVVDDEVKRQVEVYGESLIWCDETGQSDDRFMLADQPASVMGFEPEHEIAAAEFEEAWRKARTTSCQ